MRPVAVLGAGGHAKVIVAALRATGREVLGCFVRDGDELAGSRTILGAPVRHEDTLAPLLAGGAITLVIATGDNALRARLAAQFSAVSMTAPEGTATVATAPATATGSRWETVIHPSAFVDPSATLGDGVMVCAGAVLQVDVRIGAHSIINTSAHIDHDGVVGASVHIAPGCHIAGDVVIEEGAFIGTGASIIPGRRIGAWATVGAGAVVVRDVPARTVVVGVPARSRS